MKKILSSAIFILSNVSIVMAMPMPNFVVSPEQRMHNVYGYLSLITFLIGALWILFGVLELIKALKEHKKISAAVIKLLIGIAIMFIRDFMKIVEYSKYSSEVL